MGFRRIEMKRGGVWLGMLTALAVGNEASAATIDPLDIQGLELADGRLMDRPSTPVWGSSRSPKHPGVQRLRQELGRVWVDWDPARDHASGIMTTGVPAPDSTTSAAAAERLAREFIARHLEVLAPGSAIDDFVLVSNDLSSGIRTVGFSQEVGGVPVLGGQLSVRFKADRLVYVASQALPRVEVDWHEGLPAEVAQARQQARAWIEADFPGVVASDAGALEGPFILPVWTGNGWTYHEVVRATVSATDPHGRWAVYLDAGTGAPVAREQQLHSVATVRYNVPVRHPGSGRFDAAATGLQVLEGGGSSLTNANGEVTLANSPTTITTGVRGPLVEVDNDAGPEASNSFGVSDGETVVWNASGNELVDAQLSGYIHSTIVKAYVRNIAGNNPWLDETLPVSVNLGGSCNAFSDGNAINFLRADGACQNTALLADVVYHEFGHSIHIQSIIQGVGEFEGALSEGISDYLASTIVDDAGMGRGFTYSDDPLRQLDPDGFEWTWPMDKGEVHFEGQIIGGTLWDLRESLRSTLGEAAGIARTDLIWYEGIRRAVDIPSMYPEALVVDDDDGNLANGTPNICEINAAFAAHGLIDDENVAGFDITFSQVFEGGEVEVISSLPDTSECPIELDSATMSWRVRGEDGPGADVDMILQDGAWLAAIPTQDTGVVVEYQVRLRATDGEEYTYPRNEADPWYQAFFGAARPIYCFDGDSSPAEWVFEGPGSNWSLELEDSVSSDPFAPYDDDGVLLSQSGAYLATSDTRATGPTIDIGDALDLRLHYRRWLSIEDAFFDQATIYVNGQEAWNNFASEQQQGANVHHIDQEWRFHDLPLSEYIDDGRVQLSFGLVSDGGLEFGGWTIDGLCVVEVLDAVCGDGQVTGDEECDDGGTADGDGCDASCMIEEVDPDPTGGVDTGAEGGGSGAVDETGASDPTRGGGETGAGSTSGDPGQDDDGGAGGCGCASGRSAPSGGAWLLLLVIGALRRRRGA